MPLLPAKGGTFVSTVALRAGRELPFSQISRLRLSLRWGWVPHLKIKSQLHSTVAVGRCVTEGAHRLPTQLFSLGPGSWGCLCGLFSIDWLSLYLLLCSRPTMEGGRVAQ